VEIAEKVFKVKDEDHSEVKYTFLAEGCVWWDVKPCSISQTG